MFFCPVVQVLCAALYLVYVEVLRKNFIRIVVRQFLRLYVQQIYIYHLLPRYCTISMSPPKLFLWLFFLNLTSLFLNLGVLWSD
jgi:hypothetical protein